MEKGAELLHGNFYFKVLPDGAVDRAKVICNHCKVEFSYHRKYHLNALHSVDTSKSFKETTVERGLDYVRYSIDILYHVYDIRCL